MDAQELRDVMSDIASVMQAFVIQSMTPVIMRLDVMERQINALPTPKDGVDADPAKAAEIVARELRPEIESLKSQIAAIGSPVAEDAMKSYVENTLRIYDDAVANKLDKLPKPVNGKDADPDSVAEIVLRRMPTPVTEEFIKEQINDLESVLPDRVTKSAAAAAGTI